MLRRSLDKRCEARFSRAAEMAECLDRAAGELHGRAGTELAERIEEVVAAGVLERNEPVAGEDGDELTSDAHSLDEQTVTVLGPGSVRNRRKAFVLGAAVLGALGAVALPFLSRGKDVRPPAVEAPVEAPPIAAPVEGPTIQEPVAEAEPEPPPANPVVSERETATAETRPAAAEPEVEIARATPVTPPPSGYLSLSVMPWATIEWIENLETGERSPSGVATPVRLELPAGSYRLRATSPYVGKPLEMETTVRGNQTTDLRRTLAGFDAVTLAGEILAAEEDE